MSWNDVGIRHLRAFLAVSETLSFTRAAITLQTNQPSLTRSIHRLEEALKVQLFERTTRSVHLSPAGWGLRDDLRVLLPRLEEALSSHTDNAVLRLGFTWLLPDGWIQDAVSRFEAKTGVGVSLVRRDETLAGVDQGAVDVALLRIDPAARGVRVTRLGQERRAAAVPCSLPLSRRKQLYWTELARHSLVMNTVSGITRVEDWPEENRPSSIIDCGNFDEWLELIAAGKGVGVVPELVLRRRLHPDVRFIPIADAPAIPLTMLHPIQGAHPLARQFTELAQEAFAEHHTRTAFQGPARTAAAA
ncbi:LysR family transcriptional regulator [Streptomyces decoyicus]